MTAAPPPLGRGDGAALPHTPRGVRPATRTKWTSPARMSVRRFMSCCSPCGVAVRGTCASPPVCSPSLAHHKCRTVTPVTALVRATITCSREQLILCSDRSAKRPLLTAPLPLLTAARLRYRTCLSPVSAEARRKAVRCRRAGRAPAGHSTFTTGAGRSAGSWAPARCRRQGGVTSMITVALLLLPVLSLLLYGLDQVEDRWLLRASKARRPRHRRPTRAGRHRALWWSGRTGGSG